DELPERPLEREPVERALEDQPEPSFRQRAPEVLAVEGALIGVLALVRGEVAGLVVDERPRRVVRQPPRPAPARQPQPVREPAVVGVADLPPRHLVGCDAAQARVRSRDPRPRVERATLHPTRQAERLAPPGPAGAPR